MTWRNLGKFLSSPSLNFFAWPQNPNSDREGFILFSQSARGSIPFTTPTVSCLSGKLNFYPQKATSEKIIKAYDSWNKISKFYKVSYDNVKLVALGATECLEPPSYMGIAFHRTDIFEGASQVL